MVRRPAAGGAAAARSYAAWPRARIVLGEVTKWHGKAMESRRRVVSAVTPTSVLLGDAAAATGSSF
jgi:hypothetical protein